jgi:hypothetical protein
VNSLFLKFSKPRVVCSNPANILSQCIDAWGGGHAFPGLEPSICKLMFQIWKVLQCQSQTEVFVHKFEDSHRKQFKNFQRFWILERPLLNWNPFSLFAICIEKNRLPMLNTAQLRNLPNRRRFRGELSQQGFIYTLRCFQLPHCHIAVNLNHDIDSHLAGDVQFYLGVWNSGLQASDIERYP